VESDKERRSELVEDDSSSDSENLSVEEENSSWISWFCNLKGNEFFCEVDEEFIQDDFNLTGLRNKIPNYDVALDMILDQDTDQMTEEIHEVIESSAEMLYGMIHARFIITNHGLTYMHEKFKSFEFGRCPRVLCEGQAVLPIGQVDIPKKHTVKLFCPRCQEIYFPRLSRHSRIDGAYFGTSFPHLLLQMFPESHVKRSTATFVPRIFGFRIHKDAWEVAQQQHKAKLQQDNQQQIHQQQQQQQQQALQHHQIQQLSQPQQEKGKSE